MLYVFDKKVEKDLSFITLIFKIRALKIYEIFHINGLVIPFNTLQSKPLIHWYIMVPSIKYPRDDIEYGIKGDLQPFFFQEIGIYKDVAYYKPKGPSTNSKVEIKIEDKKVTKLQSK